MDQTMKDAETKQSEFEDDNSYERENESSSLYIFGLGAFALGLGYIVMQVNILRHDKKTNKQGNQSYTGRADIGGPWELVDTKGNKITEKDFQGYYYLIYFGFCNCPDICPNSLHKLAKALNKMKTMPESRYIKLKTLFISVDPDRDTYEKIDKFVSLFDTEMIGLTSESNDDPKLQDMLRKFRIYATKIEYEQMDEEEKKQTRKQTKNFRNSYTIDHTVLTYLMDDKNQYVTHLGSNLNEHELASTILEKILENERSKIQSIQ